MRKQVFRLFSGVSLAVLLAVVSAGANPGIYLRATIPFDFTVGEKTLPAGIYTVKATSTHGLLVIRSEDGTKGMFFSTDAEQTRNDPEPTKLTFRKYGNLYFLAEVCAYNEGQGLAKSRKELQVIRELRTHLAKDAGEPELVTIAAN